jgi:peptide/nickel transport system permease protein
VNPRRRSEGSTLAAGIAIVASLWLLSFGGSALWPDALHRHCPLGADVLRPDRTVCELAFGGLWISLSIGLAAGALATAFGLAIAVAARSLGGWIDAALMRFADALFALPDVLVLMVLQFAAQTLGDLNPGLRINPVLLMVISLALIAWASPARLFRNRLATLGRQDFVVAAKALGSGPGHLFIAHFWPTLRAYGWAIFLARVPAAILAESTVSFLGIGRVEPMSLGRYLGTSYGSLIYRSGFRVVLPAWGLLVLIVLGASLASRGAAALAARP